MALARAGLLLLLWLGVTSPAHAVPHPRGTDALESVRTALRLKNFAAASTELQKLATAGNPDAQYLLGCFYLNGLSGPKDTEQAKKWFMQAANQRHARAAFSLANLLASSDPPDQSGAGQWLAKAREFGFSSERGPAAPQNATPLSLLPAAQLTAPQARREGLWLAAEQGDVASLQILADPKLVAESDEFGRGALARAAQSGSVEAVVLLLDRGAAVNAVDRAGMTPLMLSARRGDAPGIDALLKRHADVNAADHNGNTPLMQAAASGKLAAVERILAARPNVAARNVQDWSALDFAEVARYADVAARLRGEGATALRRSAVDTASAPTTVQRAQRDVYAGWPDIAVAAGRPATGLLQALLAKGSDPNAVTPDGMPVLTAAVLGGPPTAVEVLLSAGALPARGDRRGASAVLTAVRADREEVLASLLAHGATAGGRADDPEAPLLAATRLNRAGMVRLLLAARAPIEARDAYGYNALMVAAQRGSLEIMRLLLEAGAPVEATDKRGRTALWHATRYGFGEGTQLLLQRGADIDHADLDGVTPLAAACATGAAAAAELLLAKGARPDTRTHGGDTPLLLAAAAGSLPTVDKLLSRAADKDAQNEFGDTALIISARKGDQAMAQRLVNAGASTLLRNKDRFTAADVAAARSFTSLSALLKGG